MASWRPVQQVLFKLLQLVNYVQMKVTAGFCQVDHSAPFGHPRFVPSVINRSMECSFQRSELCLFRLIVIDLDL